MKQYPELRCYRDVVFWWKYLLNPDRKVFLNFIAIGEDDGTGGGLQPNGALATNQWRLDRVYWGGDIAGTYIEFGQTVYASAADAINAAKFTTIKNPGLTGTYKRAVIAIRGGGTDLRLPADAVFFSANKFNEYY